MPPSIDVTMLAYSEPGIAHNIRSWLPHAKRIVIVVGATWEAELSGAPAVDSITLNAVKAISDPHKQIVVIHRDTYWKHKNEMAIAAGEVVSADMVWQVDADEFYFADDIERARLELGASENWTMAGMPHVIFWRDLSQVLRTRAGEDWFAPSRIWRRRDGQTFMHLPFATLRLADGSTRSVGVTRLDWGRCYHSSWCPPRSRLEFKFAFHKARGDGPPSAWVRDVWENGVIPPDGVHPSNPGIFPVPYDASIPEALKNEAMGWEKNALAQRSHSLPSAGQAAPRVLGRVVLTPPRQPKRTNANVRNIKIEMVKSKHYRPKS